MGIGGNIDAVIQIKGDGGKNSIGERELPWVDYRCIRGWLDLSGGDAKWSVYSAKVQESTHIFICDYQDVGVTAEECRIVIGGKIYEVLLIDNPMEMCEQLEIYLKFVGGQSGE